MLKLNVIGSVMRGGVLYFAAYNEGSDLVEFTVLDDAVAVFTALIGKGMRVVDVVGIRRLTRVRWEKWEPPTTSNCICSAK
jgi:hypothetical protein